MISFTVSEIQLCYSVLKFILNVPTGKDVIYSERPGEHRNPALYLKLAHQKWLADADNFTQKI